MNTTSTIDLTAVISLIEEYQEWKNVREEAEAEEEARKDALKAILTANDLDELTAGRFIVRFTEVKTNRFDSTAFKKEHLDLYKAFTKLSTSRRFTVSK